GALDDRLDHQVGIGHAVAGEVGLQPRGHRRALAFVLHPLGEQLLRAGDGAVDELLFAVLQRDLETLVRGPRGDVAAHYAGPDHVHAMDVVRILAAQALEPLHQEEHAGEVARGRAAVQLYHRLLLGLEQGLDPAAAAAPGLDQRVGRGVVVLARLARD